MKQQLPYGTWPSPVSPEMLIAGAVGLVDVWVDGDRTVWLESRPAEGGRLQLVVGDPDGTTRDLLPDGFNARSAVHEYGGGAAWVEDGTAWFVNWSDQRIYRMPIDAAAEPVALTAEPPEPRSVRFADLRRSPDGAWIVCVIERHAADRTAEPAVANRIAVLPADRISRLDAIVEIGDADFVMAPRFSGADRLRWIAWDHPEMPWTATTLVEAGFDADTGSVTAPRPICDGAAFMQPFGEYVISDRKGWWNVWHVTDHAETARFPVEGEVGGPAWVFGDRNYVVLDDGRLVYAIGSTLYVDGVATPTEAAALEQFCAVGTRVTAIARYRDRNPAIVRFDASTPNEWTTVVPSRPLALEADGISRPVEINFPTAGGVDAYAWFYPPANGSYEGPAGSTPPLVTMIHGGPTSDAVPWFSIARQFWTSRGFAVVDVNHRGSTGYGTAFRELLDGQWGVVDVEDCCAAATWLADHGWVDGEQMVIRGGSAGGFTVLACMASSDVFAAGASMYGVADLSALAADTHKFEARYLDRLVGPWPAAHHVYEARSPIHHLDAFDHPLIVFQGLDDRVVPPSQSEMIVAALRDKGVTCEYHAYEGEGHGFRKAETIVHQLTQELAFYISVLGLGV
jgi:dipeptidyl aminopeptidase/acylaminoacyl peptidase